MKPENQVCTREQSIQLIALGVEVNENEHGEGCAYHWINSGGGWRLAPEGYFDPFEEGAEIVPAFTVAELGVMLPDEEFSCYFGLNSISSWQWHDPKTDEECGFFTNEAEARADRLLTLLGNAEITAEQVNQRLAAA